MASIARTHNAHISNRMDKRQVIIWLALNLSDLLLSILAFQWSGRELSMLVWLLERAPGAEIQYRPDSYLAFGLCKMGLAVGALLLLSAIRKPHLLKWLNLALLILCLYTILMLILTFRP